MSFNSFRFWALIRLSIRPKTFHDEDSDYEYESESSESSDSEYSDLTNASSSDSSDDSENSSDSDDDTIEAISEISCDSEMEELRGNLLN